VARNSGGTSHWMWPVFKVHPLNSVISDDAIVLEQLQEAVTYTTGHVSQSR
jgi:hypothetical protein